MKVTPSVSTTKYGREPFEWIPFCFESFLQELNYIKAHCVSLDHLVLFRGHRNSQWLLDSTFVRYVKENILGISTLSRVRSDYRGSMEFHRLLGGLFLYKFGTLTEPSQDLFLQEEQNGIDPWFEWMKRIQQYPTDDLGPMWGSFLVDWTQKQDVAVYFANEGRHPLIDGAVWISDIKSSGRVLHTTLPVKDILSKLQDALHNDRPFGCPLVFYPGKQLKCQRANNQAAVYVAQMDMRYDLAEIWSQKEAELENGDRIFIKLILPSGTKDECDEWLVKNSITSRYIYPDN